MVRLVQFIVILVITLAVSACNFRDEKIPQGPPGGGPLGANQSRFEEIKAAVFGPKCMECHHDTVETKLDLTGYDSLMASGDIVSGNPAQSRLYQLVEAGKMPKGGAKLPDSELKLISDWILDGAK